MADQETIIEQKEEVVTANPFDEGTWGTTQAVVEQKQEEVKKEEVIEQKQEAVVQKTEDEIVDANEYLKTNLGFDDWDSAKKAIDEYKQLKNSKPTEFEFANDDSKKLFEAIRAGKEDEVYAVLEQKRTFSKLETLNVDDAKQAAQLLQLNLQLKHKDLSNREIMDWFDESYGKPEKPKQEIDQTDDEYKETVEKWQARCDAIDRKIVRDAKIAKPDVLKLKSEIVLPDIPKAKEETQATKQLTQEELLAAEKFKNEFLQAANKSATELKGFSAQVKDKDVDFTVSYVPSTEEKAAIETNLKAFAEVGFNANHIFAQRWVNEDGTVNTSKMAEELALLDNKEKVFQKIATDAANQRLEQYLKSKKNINMQETSTTTNFNPTGEKTNQENMAEHFFSN